MDPEKRSFGGASELFNSSPSVTRAVDLDDKDELVAQMKRLAGDSMNLATASKLLHLCCKSDSAECASALLGGELGTIPLVNELDDSGKSPLHTAALAHARRCVEVLLKKHARTDLKTRDRRAQLALELSLSDARMEVCPSPNFNLVIHSSEKDLSTVKLLSEKTKEIAEVAYSYAVKGRVASLTALLIVAAEKVNNSVLELRDSDSGRKEKVTIFECLIREALALGRRTRESENSERRKLLLCEIELLQLFGVVAQSSGGGDKKLTSPLILAAQRGDGDVIQLLLKTNIDVNDADADGNSALHWILGLSRLSCPLQIRIVLLLLEHGAIVSQRNKLGLTAFHIAAGNGNAEALEVLLLEDPDGVQYMTEMKETPLFFAVKNESKDCAKLLLTWGANSEVLNLRRQRATDLATSQEMRYILLNPTTISLINDAFPYQLKCMALELADEETTTKRNVNSSTKADVCKYFNCHQGCVRGAKCFNAHCEESQKVKEGEDRNYSSAAKLLKRKIFVGGLPPSVDSDALRKLCEEEFGSVEDAVVIVTQIENKIQSRGFGFVTFRGEKSASEAMLARYITLRGKKVEIKSLIPKLVLGADVEKMSPQPQDQEKNFQYQLPLQKPNENIVEGDNPEQSSWADRLVLKQPAACSVEPQAHVTKSSEDPSTPTWLKVFNKWFPGFLQGLSKHSNYALSSLKADFRAKFGLELDHSSVGYSKLSDFLKRVSDLCTIEILPVCKHGTPTHMILRPKFSSPQCRLLPILRTTHTLSLSAFIVNGGDSKCLSSLLSGDGGDLKDLQNLSTDSGSDAKCLQDLPTDNAIYSKCLQDLSLDSGGDSECIGDEMYGSRVTSHGEEKPSSGYPEMNSIQDKAHCLHPRFLQFLKLDPLLHGQSDSDNEKGQCNAGDKNASESYFLHESDSCKVKGTTSIAWVSKECECVVLATDSRGTLKKSLVLDNYKKFEIITPHIVSTSAGDSLEAAKTCRHMKLTINDETRNGTDLNCVWNVGVAGQSMERDPDARSTMFLIAGLQSEAPNCCFLYDLFKEKEDRACGLEEVPNWKAIGSGFAYAEAVVKRMWKKYQNAQLSQIVQILNFSILMSALFNEATGGLLTVICVGKDGVSILSCCTVLELYISFYNVTIRLPRIEEEDGVSEDKSNFIELVKLKELEGKVVFLFYHPHAVGRGVMKKWLRRRKGIEASGGRGHPLTELAGQYYMHRVVFKTAEDCSAFLGKAQQITQQTLISFSSRREDFRYVMCEKNIIFVARQTLEMLKSLEISETMNKRILRV